MFTDFVMGWAAGAATALWGLALMFHVMERSFKKESKTQSKKEHLR